MSSEVYQVNSPDLVQEVQNHQPIPYGWFKLLLWGAAMTAIPLLMYLDVLQYGPESTRGKVIFACVIDAVIVILSVMVGGYYWLRDYHSQNVVAWKLVCWGEGGKFFCKLLRRGRNPDVSPVHHPLSIPLGGWWFKKAAMLKADETYANPWIRELLFDAQVFLSFHGIMIAPSTVNQLGVWLHWRDRDKNRMTMELEHALGLIWESWVDTGPHRIEGPDMSLRGMFHHQRGQLRIVRGTLENSQRDWSTVNRRHNLAAELASSMILFLHRLVGRIEDTSRLGPSKEGQRLRESIEDFLAEYLPEGHKYQERYVRRCAERLQAGRSGGEVLEGDSPSAG